MSILRFLGLGGREEVDASVPSDDTETVRKIVDALDRMEAERARYVAAFAYVLGRVAFADREISSGETRTMERLVMKHGRLPEEQAILVVQIAKSQNLLFGGTEDYLVTRQFGDIATREQKMALLDCLFAVSSSDRSIVSAEDTIIRKISGEIRLDHKDFIAVRSRYRDYLEVLKKDEES